MHKFLISLIVVLLVFSSVGTALAQGSGDVYDELIGAVSGLVGPGKAKGAVLAIVHNGEIRYCSGFGFADEFNGIKADGAKTAFRIGSVSKTFVAVAAQILSQEGRLDMDRDISDYLESDFPALSYPVTMRQLLTHTAGFEDMVTGIAVSNVSDTEPLSKSVRKYRPAQVFIPGEVTSYSNYGIALAAYAVECVSGQDFAQFCSERIFLPLDMHRTTFEHMHDVVYVSKPYLPSGEETHEPYMNLYPEGSAVSTAEDMASYMLWLLDKDDSRVLSAQSKAELFYRQFSMSDEMAGMGYIWNRKERNGKLYYDKKGETLHFYSRIALYPEAQTGIFLSFNTYLSEHEINAVMNKTTDLLCGKASETISDFGNAAIDISGHYVNNWSSFSTPEKILRYIVPGKVIHIEGTPKEGFSIDGESMAMVAEDMYSSPMGVLKFLKKDGKIMIATESAITFSKLPFWQHRSMQILAPLSFAVLVFAYLLRELILSAQKKRAGRSAVFLICLFVQLLSFCVLYLLLYKGLAAYSLLSLVIPLRICGWLIIAASAAGIAYTGYLKARHNPIKPLPVVWNIASILFCVWMAWMNML